MESWKQIPDYEFLYEASSLGRIKSVLSGKIIKPRFNRQGYLKLGLYRNKKQTTFFVHRLVAMAFLGKSNLDVDHINNIKFDNKLDNIRYVTKRQNQHFRELKRDLPVGVRKKGKKFQARITINKRLFTLGTFNTPEQAHLCFKAKMAEL
jgi:hypothetical protein